MSLHTEDTLEGFAELLDVVGVDLQYGEATFRGVLATEQPSNEPYALTPGDDQAVMISAFASTFSSRPAIGEYFKDDSGNHYRIKSRRQRPGQLIIRFSCEVSEIV